MNDINLHIDTWRKRLGLFPMPLFRDLFHNEKYILLNGGITGNLCLDFNRNSITDARDFAWSADVGHYLVIEGENVANYRWDSFKPEKYSTKSVGNNLEEFYNYLRKQDLKRQNSIIKFGIQFYRSIRTLLRDNAGSDAINVLLYLFACVAEDNIERNEISLSKWALSEETKNKSLEINQPRWDELLEMFTRGLNGLQPNIELFLRHASGSLFQEAHFETLFPSIYQPSFENLIPQSDDLLNKKNKSQTSAHFTPLSIVRTIVEEAIRNFSYIDKKEITVLDPACGSGEFLKEFIRQIRLAGYKNKIKVIGWDISQTAVDMANFIVNYEIQSFKEPIEVCIFRRDALLNGERWHESVDIVLMNPPFISWELLNEDEREKISLILGNLKSKKPNTAGAFLWNAIKCLNENGVIGCVLPTSMFENDSYITLREEIKNIIDIKILGRLGSHSLFSNALVDAAIIVGSKKNTSDQCPLVIWSDYKLESSTKVLRELRKIRSITGIKYSSDEGYSLYENPYLIKNENWMPIPFNSFELLARYKSFTKVEDIFDVKQGVRTGLNSAFLITKSYLNKLGAKERNYFRPAVTNESISNCQLNDNYYIFYPEGEYLISSHEELRRVVPNYYQDKLKPNYERLSNRARKSSKNFWRLSEHRAWQIENVPKIVSKEFGKAGSFAYDFSGVFVTERSHAWLIKKHTELGNVGYAYITILTMPIINDFLAGISKQIGGGQWYLSSKYINKMPLPDLFSGVYDDLLDTLIDMGVRLKNGALVDQEQLTSLSKIIFHV